MVSPARPIRVVAACALLAAALVRVAPFPNPTHGAVALDLELPAPETVTDGVYADGSSASAGGALTCARPPGCARPRFGFAEPR